MVPIYKRASEKNGAKYWYLCMVIGPAAHPIWTQPPVRVQMRDLRVWRCKTWICFLACKPLIENITCWVFLAEGRPRGRDSRHRPHTTHSSKCIPHVYHTYTTQSATTFTSIKLPNYPYTTTTATTQSPNRHLSCWICWKTMQKTYPYPTPTHYP